MEPTMGAQSADSETTDSSTSENPTQNNQPSESLGGFSELQLCSEVLAAVKSTGYDTPTPIQAQIIPFVLKGRDVLAQSQTGTGKTAAFALPLLSRLDFSERSPQVLVLAPTRELAIQVSRSFATYGAHLPDFRVATIYGGQSYDPQLKQLRRGPQVVIGTPGRVIDHIKRGTLRLDCIRCLVLDEADEMLNMGFLEDVKFVLDKAPDNRQIALFSATLPGPIRTIAERYLNNPAKIQVQRKEMTAELIRQRAIFVSMRDRPRALVRVLEAEATDGVIVFTKTRAATTDVSEDLLKAGLKAVALNGDMPQATRERTVERFKAGHLDVLVATDVAARGLDVPRVSHVINYDLPHDAEAYVHRIGRTGRAGRTGEAIMLMPHSQRHKLRFIERATKKPIEVVALPTAKVVNERRVERFREQISQVAESQDLGMFEELIRSHAAETGLPLETIAAALAHIGQNGRPFLAKDRPARKELERDQRGQKGKRLRFDQREGEGERRGRDGKQKSRTLGPPKEGMERFRVDVGRKHGVRPGNLVGAIANEGGIEGEYIGPIRIHDGHSTIDLPEGMPSDVFATLRTAWVVGQKLNLRRDSGSSSNSSDGGDKGPKAPRKVRVHGKKHKKRRMASA